LDIKQNLSNFRVLTKKPKFCTSALFYEYHDLICIFVQDILAEAKETGRYKLGHEDCFIDQYLVKMEEEEANTNISKDQRFYTGWF
jgi:hypothetical protein